MDPNPAISDELLDELLTVRLWMKRSAAQVAAGFEINLAAI